MNELHEPEPEEPDVDVVVHDGPRDEPHVIGRARTSVGPKLAVEEEQE